MDNGARITADWIAVDWGTSHLRAWAMGADGAVLGQASSPQGMARLARAEFEPALQALVAGWLDGPTLAVACGMVGSRQGWVEARYADAPCPPPEGAAAVRAPTEAPGLDMRILPGIRQTDPPDVMRGEETQVAGLLAREPDFDGGVCLPGTHTKWVRVSAGEVVSFRTFMTGELFALLSQTSVLRHAVAGEDWDAVAFEVALGDAMARPHLMSSDLFTLRAAQLVHDQAPAVARARLSGLLIGLELAGARPYWLGQRLALVGTPALTERYATALAAQGAPAEVHEGDALVLAGLAAAHAQVKEPAP